MSNDQGGKPPQKTIMGWQSPFAAGKPPQGAAPPQPQQPAPPPAGQPPQGFGPPPGMSQPGMPQQPPQGFGPPPGMSQPGMPQQPPQGFGPPPGMSQPGMPQQPPQGFGPPPGMSQPGMPQQPPPGYPQQPQPGYPQPQQPPQGFGPQPGMPQPGMPQPGYPQPPQPGYPQPPQPGYPQQQGMPPSGMPQQPQQQGMGMGMAAGAIGGGMAGGLGGIAGGLKGKLGGFGKGKKGGDAQARGIAGADATVGQSDRVRFIKLTYIHLFAAICAFAAIETALFKVDFLIVNVTAPILEFAIYGGRWNWLAVLGLFMAVSWVADYWARNSTSRKLQYLGLGLYVVAEALIFLPLIFLAELKGMEIAYKQGAEPGSVHIVRDSAYLTLALFGALTATVLFTKKDFSFIRGALAIGSAAAMGLILLSIIAGFNLGIVFSVAMVLLAAGYVLFYTSQILAHYNPQQYVAASLALFSSVALMFWYVIRVMMRLRG